MIYVFKTSVGTKRQAKRLKPHLDKLLPKATWNFDLQDCDHILRIDSDENVISPVVKTLQEHHFHCESLD